MVRGRIAVPLQNLHRIALGFVALIGLLVLEFQHTMWHSERISCLIVEAISFCLQIRKQ